MARAGFNTIFATRFGFPIRTYVLKTAFRAAANNVTVGGSPHVDPVPLVKRAKLFDGLAAKSIKNGPFSGAAAEKEVRSEARGAPVPGGPGATKTGCFQMFLKNEQHPGSACRKMSKSYVGPKVPKWPLAGERSNFRKRFCLRLCEWRRQPKQIIFGPSCLSQKLFRTLDKPSCFVKARASNKNYAS